MTSDSTSASNTTQQVTVIAPINIALIKYWGKRDEDLVLPLNDSVSLNVDDLYAKTRIRTGASIHEDSVAVNGRAVDLSKPNRFSSDGIYEVISEFVQSLKEVRRISRKRLMNDDGDTQENPACFQKFEASFPTVLLQATVVSETNFPVEAGLASSAAGFAAVAFALGHLYKLKNDEIIRIARLGKWCWIVVGVETSLSGGMGGVGSKQDTMMTSCGFLGSGSACRSMLGGFVHWKAGTRVDGSDCCCEVVAPAEHWSTLCAIIVVTSRDSKHTSSTDGMRRSVQTSQLLSFRAKEVVPGRVSRLLKAIASKDFEQLATITMSESNQLHAICMDTMPPLKYMNGNSWRLVRLVEALNAHSGCKRVAYTFDAGPNCCLFVETHFVPTVFAALLRYCHLPTALFDKLGASSAGREWPQLRETAENLQKNVTLNGVEPAENVVHDIFLSHVGGQPTVVL
ncbi:unnamed protein product [Toxocara canis]|uniref:Diphosphomevalonate decarboxylase n=1 Tax=Toxocara canis TaxID=6265 RepID=A0A183UXS6_TOXCA|nr:unnamed protein product [Toxocara canis]